MVVSTKTLQLIKNHQILDSIFYFNIGNYFNYNTRSMKSCHISLCVFIDICFEKHLILEITSKIITFERLSILYIWYI